MLQMSHLIHDIKFQSGKLKGNSSGKIIVSFWNIRTNTKIFPNDSKMKAGGGGWVGGVRWRERNENISQRYPWKAREESKGRSVNAKIPLLTQEQLLLLQPPFFSLSTHITNDQHCDWNSERVCITLTSSSQPYMGYRTAVEILMMPPLSLVPSLSFSILVPRDRIGPKARFSPDVC